MNRVIMHGRISTDIDKRMTSTGKSVATFNVAVNRPYQKDAVIKADFFPCVAWERLADFIGNNFSKGKEILIEGILQTRSYEKDGSKRYVTEIILTYAEFCGSKTDVAKSTTAGISGKEVDDDIPF